MQPVSAEVPGPVAARPVADTSADGPPHAAGVSTAATASSVANSAAAAPAPPGPNLAAANASPPSFLRRHRTLLAAAAVGIALAGGWAVWAWLGPQVETTPVLRRDLVQTIVASGQVQTPHRLDVAAQITGTVAQVPVAEGQRVQAGEVLVLLNAAELSASSRQADAAVGQAQARWRQLQEVQAPVAAQALRQARSQLANARATLARSQVLFGQGFIGQAALDDARQASELADAQLRAAQTQWEATGAAGSASSLALADVAGAQANAQAARARAGYAAIRAPVAGTLIARNVEVGDVVQAGKLLMTLSPQGRTQLVVQIDEKNLALLALGQRAWASADAYPAQRFAATLAFINPGVNATTGAVEIKLDVPAPPALLKQDMTVSVDIEVARRPLVLVVPLAAVHAPESDAPWVLRLEGRHAQRRAVRLGLRSGGWAEVLGGAGKAQAAAPEAELAEGDVLITAPATLAPGARVRAKPPAQAPAAAAVAAPSMAPAPAAAPSPAVPAASAPV